MTRRRTAGCPAGGLISGGPVVFKAQGSRGTVASPLAWRVWRRADRQPLASNAIMPSEVLRIGTFGLTLAFGILIGAWSLPGRCWGADQRTTKAGRAARNSNAESVSGKDVQLEKRLNELQRKLDEVLANQASILGRFDAVMEELRIIKVRATIRGGS